MTRLSFLVSFALLVLPRLASAAVGLPTPLGRSANVEGIIGRVIKGAIGLSGSLALVMFVYGGFLWMTAAGNDEKVKKGKNTVVWAVLGLMAVFLSYALVSLLTTAVGA